MRAIIAYAGIISFVGLLLQADDFQPNITARISVGVTGGIRPSDSSIDDAVNSLAGFGSVTLDYQPRSAFNGEIPVLINFRNSSKIYPIAGVGFITSVNNNDYSGTITNSHGVTDFTGKDKYTELGAKAYVGAGVGGSNGWHGEFLADVGAAALKEETSITITGPGGRISDNATGHGSETMYGLTFGVYYTPDITKGIQIGARVGWFGATGSIDGGDVRQGSGLFAVEAGWLF